MRVLLAMPVQQNAFALQEGRMLKSPILLNLGNSQSGCETISLEGPMG